MERKSRLKSPPQDTLMSTFKRLQESAKKKKATQRRNPLKTAKKRPKKENKRSSTEHGNKRKQTVDDFNKPEMSASYKKYGVVLPSFEKILAEHKKWEEHKERLKLLDSIVKVAFDASLTLSCTLEKKGFKEDLLDCKHLSLEQLDEAFKRHKQKLSGIMSGKSYSKRHYSYYHLPLRCDNSNISNDLRCSTSVVVFNEEQQERMLNLMEQEFDPEHRMMEYLFMVLLPEFCLLIFMDVHKMDKQKASAYLDRRPLDF